MRKIIEQKLILYLEIRSQWQEGLNSIRFYLDIPSTPDLKLHLDIIVDITKQILKCPLKTQDSKLGKVM